MISQEDSIRSKRHRLEATHTLDGPSGYSCVAANHCLCTTLIYILYIVYIITLSPPRRAPAPTIWTKPKLLGGVQVHVPGERAEKLRLGERLYQHFVRPLSRWTARESIAGHPWDHEKFFEKYKYLSMQRTSFDILKHAAGFFKREDFFFGLYF